MPTTKVERLQRLNTQFKDGKEEQLLDDFRRKAQDKFNNKQGAIKKALLEALTLWVKAN